jgi:hypothetical protein
VVAVRHNNPHHSTTFHTAAGLLTPHPNLLVAQQMPARSQQPKPPPRDPGLRRRNSDSSTNGYKATLLDHGLKREFDRQFEINPP